VIDGHVHVWRLDRRPQSWIDPTTMAVLHRDHPMEELVPELDAAGVSGVVLVQVLNQADETDDYLWEGTHPRILGVVGWADLRAPTLDDELDRLTAHPLETNLVGIRHQTLAEPDPAGWLRWTSESGGFDVLGRRGLACDLMLGAVHLEAVAEVVGRHTGTRFVLDHVGKAPIVTGWSSEASQKWAADIADVARHQHVVCKLSGLTTIADVQRWQPADLAPYVDHLLEQFGPDRMLWGSDWPVSLRGGSYQRTAEAVRGLLEALSPEERANVLGGVAERVYGILDPTAA
jgi:L-fuconolactonase